MIMFLLAGCVCKGQADKATDTIFIADVITENELLHKTAFYYDHTRSLPVTAVLQKPFQRFKKIYQKIKIQPENINSVLYLKILLNNNTGKEITTFLNPGIYFSHYDLYRVDGLSITNQDSGNVSNFKKITVAAGEICYFLLKIKPLKTLNGEISPTLINTDYLEEYRSFITTKKSEVHIYGLLLSGIMLMMIIFMLANFLVSPKKEFLYNAAYSVCMFFLIYNNSTLSGLSTPFISFYFTYFNFFLLIAGAVFYISFVRKFLDTKNSHVLLDLILKTSVRYLLLLLVIFTFFNFFTETFLPQYYLENVTKILFLLLGVASIKLALERKDRLFSYIAIGNGMLVFFSFISLIIQFLPIKHTNFFNAPVSYYNTGIVLELSFFLLGLTYKNRRELIKEIKKQGAFKLENEKKDFETKLAVLTAQQEERNRISADMHDDLGAGMTTISLYSELAKTKLANNPIPEIDKISAASNDLLNKMNAIIWSMSSSNDSLGNTIGYIRSYALEYFEDTGINCSIEIAENLPNIEVKGEIRRNVFLVVKEALNNILKHAKASEVSIKLVRVENSLTLCIQDNGRGIDMDKVRPFGNGLKNMKKRMADIGVEFTIENSNGTLITMNRKIRQF